MALQLKDQSREGKIKFLMEAMSVDAGRASRVANNPSQFAAYVADFERGLNRFAADPEKSIGGYLNATASTSADMTQARKEAERQNVLTRSMSGGGLKAELSDAYNYIKKVAEYVTPDTIDRFNSLLQNAQKIDSSLNFAPVKGGTGTGDINWANEATMPGQGLNQKNTSSVRSSPPKQSDYKTFADYQSAMRDYQSGLSGSTSSGSSQGTSTGSSFGGGLGTSTTMDRSAQMQSAIDFINSQDLPADVKALYIATVQNWDPNLELNAENIISTFQKIKSETIDPRFQGLTNLAIESVKTAQKAYADQRALELEAEATNRAEAIRGVQSGLEASGLTFSGEGVRQLGTDLAAPVTFGGPSVEGLVPKQNRLISTSSEAAYQQNLKNLGLTAEEQLGSSGVKGIVPGYVPVGSVVGSLTEEKQAAEGAVLGNVLNQGISNVQDDVNTDYSQTSYAS